VLGEDPMIMRGMMRMMMMMKMPNANIRMVRDAWPEASAWEVRDRGQAAFLWG
jgi:hypothetical protein